MPGAPRQFVNVRRDLGWKRLVIGGNDSKYLTATFKLGRKRVLDHDACQH
jgi:hypothetical protein